jgi:hypothetical protein
MSASHIAVVQRKAAIATIHLHSLSKIEFIHLISNFCVIFLRQSGFLLGHLYVTSALKLLQ